MWRVWLEHHKVSLCQRCWLRWSSSMATMADQPFAIEPLTPSERDRILPSIVRPRKGQAEAEWYLEAIRSMEPGKLHRITPGVGHSPVRVWYRLNRAARTLDMELHWPAGRPPAKQPSDQPLYCELASSPGPKRNGTAREPAQALSTSGRSAF